MKKIFTVLIAMGIVLFASKASAVEVYDYCGSYTISSVEGIEGTFSDVNPSNWVGQTVNIKHQSPFDFDNELQFENFLTFSNFIQVNGLVDLATGVGAISSKLSTFDTGNEAKEAVYVLTTTDPSAEDADSNRWSYYWDLSYSQKADGYKDLKFTYSADRSTITVENIALQQNYTNVVTIKKIVLEKPKSPNMPDVYALFNVKTGKMDVTVTAPSTLDYDNNYAPLDKNLSKVVLERSLGRYYGTWSQVKEWTDVVPGAELEYEDSDLDFEGSETYYNYRAVAYLGESASEYSNDNGSDISAPAPNVKNLKVTASEGGVAPVTVSFNLPSAEELQIPLTKVIITRMNQSDWNEEELISYTDNLTADKEIVYVDNKAQTGNKYEYTVSTEWKYGQGWGESTSIFVGTDAPGRVSDFNVAVDGLKATLTWKAPEKGRNDGYVDASKVRYKITRRESKDMPDWDNGGIYHTMVELTPAEGIAETTFVDNIETDVAKGFDYEIYTFNEGEAKKAENAGYASVVAGPKLQLPFYESFDVAKDDYERNSKYFWNINTETDWCTFMIKYFNSWSDEMSYNTIYPSNDPVNDPEMSDSEYHPYGMLSFSSSEWAEWNEKVNLTSYAIDLSKASNPVAVFDVFQYSYENTGKVTLKAGDLATDNSELLEIGSVNVCDPALYDEVDNAHTGKWTTFYMPMTELAGNDNVKINLTLEMGDNDKYLNYKPVCVDEIKIIDIPGVTELSATQADGKVTIEWTDPYDLIEVKDENAFLVSSFDIYKDGKIVETINDDNWATEYTDTDDGGNHEYYIVANYTDPTVLSTPKSPSVYTVARVADIKVEAGAVKWTNPSTAGFEVDHFEVYRDGAVAEANCKDNEYKDSADKNAHYYSVVAKYILGGKEYAAPASDNVYFYAPAYDLEVAVVETEFVLTWANPSSAAVVADAFEVYRDGEVVEANCTETTYRIAATDDQTHKFHVVAKYADNKADNSNEVSAQCTGVDAMQATGKVSVAGNVITVQGRAAIYSASGVMLAESVDGLRYAAAPGVYVVLSDNKTTKVIIK